MSNKLVKRKDPGTRVVDAVVTDGVTAAVTVGTVLAVYAIPVFGWLAGVAGVGYLGYRAVRRGLNEGE